MRKSVSLRAVGFAALLGALILPAGMATAQTYPDHGVKIIVPVGPAGSYDIVGRLLADQLTRRLGQTVVVENRPGGGAIIGTQAVATAAPDGYTLLIGGLANMIFNAGLYKKLPYDPLADFVPVAIVFNISYTMVGAKSLPYSTPKEVIEAARKSPDGLKVAHVGTGSGQHIFSAAFQKLTGTKFLEVSYRGSAAAFPDILAGRVDLFVDSTPAALPYVKGGQVKGLGVLARTRHPQMPDVPTMTEAGVPGLEIELVDRPVRARQDAGHRRCAPAAGDRAGAAGAQAPLRDERWRAHGDPARQAQRLRARRIRPLAQGDPRRRHQLGLTRHRRASRYSGEG